ncbi:hypothetical protein O3M35_000208 [Rhynocoris fuscipes]|uniref:Polycystin domain-containing protein n=1 Tax=Rhynocoris fuscipes TaxID=488301 RepID=A0AAW1DQV6_9HEMI
MLGIPRLRQLRVSSNYSKTVPKLFRPWYSQSIGFVNKFNEEISALRQGWTRLPKYYQQPYIWSYGDYKATESVAMFGRSGLIYHDGGYVEQLERTMGNSHKTLTELVINDWFDNYTRFVVLEANFYNINSNLLSVVSVIVENLPNGVCMARVNVESSYLFILGYIYNRYVITCTATILLLIIIIVMIVKSSLLMSFFGSLKFFTNPWTVIDSIIILLGILMVIWYFKMIIYFHLYIEVYERNRADEFTSFYFPMGILSESSLIMAVFSFLASIRCINFIRFKSYSLLEKFIRLSAVYLLYIFLIFIYIEQLFLYTAEMFNYPLLYKYIIFPIYNSFYYHKVKNTYYENNFYPLIFAYICKVTIIFTTVILIGNYRKAKIKEVLAEKLRRRKRYVPNLTLDEITSQSPFYKDDSRKGLRLKGGSGGYHIINNNKISTESMRIHTQQFRRIISKSDSIIDLTSTINSKLNELIESL